MFGCKTIGVAVPSRIPLDQLWKFLRTGYPIHDKVLQLKLLGDGTEVGEIDSEKFSAFKPFRTVGGIDLHKRKMEPQTIGTYCGKDKRNSAEKFELCSSANSASPLERLRKTYHRFLGRSGNSL